MGMVVNLGHVIRTTCINFYSREPNMFHMKFDFNQLNDFWEKDAWKYG